MKAKGLRYGLIALLAILTALSVIGCGSSSGGGGGASTSTPAPTVSGVAATGAPMSGDVYFKDSAGAEHGPYPINPTTGSFVINNVENFPAPYYIKACDTQGNNCLYSVAMGAGTHNINPMTNLAVADAADVSDLAIMYTNPSAHPINQTSLNQALSDLSNMLMASLNKYGVSNVNPFTDSFTVGAGLDLLFDDVGISINTNTGEVIITDKTGNNPLVIYVSGDGFTNSNAYMAASINESSLATLATSTLNYDDVIGRLTFQSSSITDVKIIVGASEITGVGTATERSASGNVITAGCTFTVTISDSNPDAVSIEILRPDNSLLYNATSQAIMGGTGFLVEIK